MPDRRPLRGTDPPRPWRAPVASLLLLLAACGDDGASAPGEDAAPGARCAPSGGGPHWITEGETITFPVACATGLAAAGDEFRFAALPRGAAYDPTTATFTWTPGLDQAAVVHLELRRGEEAGEVVIGVADRFDDPENTPVVDPFAYTEEYGLPVLFLATAGPVVHDVYQPATVIYRGRAWSAEAELRGNTSLGYPKNSYSIKFPREDKFSDPDRAGGFLEKRKIALITTFDDSAQLRQRLAYELWARMDARHLAVQAYHAVVFLDGRYHGLYVVTDVVNGWFVEEHGLRQRGNLYKAVTHDANFGLESLKFGGLKETLHQGLEKKEGIPVEGEPGAFDDLDALVEFVALSGDAEFAAGIGDRIELADYLDWWIFVTLIRADDSAGKNAYHYHDPLAPGGRFRYVPWDFNASFGQAWDTARVPPEGMPTFVQVNELFRRFLAEPTIDGPLRARYRALLADRLAAPKVMALVDEIAAEIAPAALRDERKWGAAHRAYEGWSQRSDFLGFDDEVVYVREWIDRHWRSVADEL